MADALGDRMKLYEGRETGRLMPRLPVVARLDGKNFSNWTRGLRRPYDEDLIWCMGGLTKYLVAKTAALVGYTQSDEISLLWYSDSPKSQIYFDGKIQKMVSVLASEATAHFNYLVGISNLPEMTLALFDCRVWAVPTKDEAANAFLWREQDATKNSIAMAAQSVYSHNELFGKHQGDMMEMLHAAGINWNDYPPAFKRGTWVAKRKVLRRFSCEEIEALPPKHEARTNPDLEVRRTDYVEIDMPPFGRVTNRVGVLFDGQPPLVASEG